MNTKYKRILVTIVVLILIPSALFVANLAHIQIRRYHLQHADHTRILAACREAITNRSFYRKDNAKWGVAYEDRDDVVVLLPPLPDNLPQAIRDLEPGNILISENNVIINLSLPFSRLGFIGFKPNAKQYGTFRYIDGLWFWNGNDKTKSKQNGQ